MVDEASLFHITLPRTTRSSDSVVRPRMTPTVVPDVTPRISLPMILVRSEPVRVMNVAVGCAAVSANAQFEMNSKSSPVTMMPWLTIWSAS